MINIIRIVLSELLSEYEVKSPITLPYTGEELKEILFEKSINYNGEEHYVFYDELESVIHKIDLSNVSFDNVYVEEIDFSNLHGVKINPQTIYDKNLYKTILNGVEFVTDDKNIIDLFDGVDVRCANFTGSKGAKINPQTIKGKNLYSCVLCDVDFTGFSFDGVSIEYTDFEGSKGAKINPITTNVSDDETDWCNVEFTDLPLDLDPDFYRGSNYNELLEKKEEYKTLLLDTIKEQLKGKVDDLELDIEFEFVDMYLEDEIQKDSQNNLKKQKKKFLPFINRNS